MPNWSHENFCVYLYQSSLMRTYLCTSTPKWSHENIFVYVYNKVVSWKHICVYLYKSGLMTTFLCVLQSGLMNTILCVSIPKWSHGHIFVCIYYKVVSWQHICTNRYNNGLMKTYLCVSIPKWSQENIQNVYLYQSGLMSKNFSISIPEKYLGISFIYIQTKMVTWEQISSHVYIYTKVV